MTTVAAGTNVVHDIAERRRNDLAAELDVEHETAYTLLQKIGQVTGDLLHANLPSLLNGTLTTALWTEQVLMDLFPLWRWRQRSPRRQPPQPARIAWSATPRRAK